MKKFATAVAVTLMGASLAMAAPNQGGWKGHHHGVFGKKLAEKLNLTDAQKAQVKDIVKASRQENKAFFESARATFKDYRAAKQANDTAKMDALKPTIDANRAQMKQIRTAEEAKIAQVLTPEQNAQWQQLKAARAAKHQRG
jgi:periplasmic protein CpxP/Spy